MSYLTILAVVVLYLVNTSHGEQGLFNGPFVVAHRGASGILPEHTVTAYELAIEQGADFIECDVVLTKDLQPVCRHEPNINATTDVFLKFPERVRTYEIDGENVTGIFTIDLTLAELATVRAVQPWPFRNKSFDGLWGVPTLQQFIAVAQNAPRVVGIYPEVKHPAWHNTLPMLRGSGVTIQDIMLGALLSAGYGQGPLHSPEWYARPVFIQSFEPSSLQDLAAKTVMPLVLLLGGWPGYVAPDTKTSHDEMVSSHMLQDYATYVQGVGPWKNTTVVRGEGGRLVSSGLVEQLHSLGMQVHPYTFRAEPQFVLPGLDGNLDREFDLFFSELRIDAAFTDFPGLLREYLNAHTHPNMSGSTWLCDGEVCKDVQ